MLFIQHALEIRLSHLATRGVAAPLNGEQAVHASVRRVGESSIRIGREFETGFTHRTVQSDERWNRVGRAIQICDCNLRVHGRACSTEGGLRVTART
jgi:hypothetical protein